MVLRTGNVSVLRLCGFGGLIRRGREYIISEVTLSFTRDQPPARMACDCLCCVKVRKVVRLRGVTVGQDVLLLLCCSDEYLSTEM